MDKNIFYNFDKVVSYNSLFNFIIGERGVGKSYGAKKFVTNRFIKKKKQFVYLRRYKSELKESTIKNGNGIWFNQIKDEFKDHELSNTKDVFYIDKEVAGFCMPLSTANILKSATFENVDTIIFDEFIIDKGTYHYLQNEVTQLMELFETIARLREVKIYFLGNAISITNPYFIDLNLTLPYNSDIKVFKRDNKGQPLILVNYIKNIPYREVKKETRFGQLIDGTKYGKYAIDNEMLRDSKAFIKKRSNEARFFFCLIINGVTYGIWNDYKNEMMFISNKFDPNCPIRFTLNTDDHDYNTILIKARNSTFFKSIIDHYRLGRLCFENQQIKNNVMKYIEKSLTF